MNKLSQLETCFQTAACTLTAPIGYEIECGCGRPYRQATENDPPVQYGTFSGYTMVRGCTCPGASSFAGMLWSERHQVAVFYREMISALEADMVRLRGEMPTDLGAKEADRE